MYTGYIWHKANQRATKERGITKMKAYLLKVLKRIPPTITTTVKKEIGYQASLIPLKAQLNLEQKLKGSLTASINEYKDIPQKLHNEFRRISTHQSSQPFSGSSNQYFNNYYQSQQQRATATPQPNLAEIMYIREQQTRRY